MPITDLTGTKWVFNETFSTNFYHNMGNDSLFFMSNGNNYDCICVNIDKTGFSEIWYSGVGSSGGTSLVVFSDAPMGASWVDDAYRTIEITGGGGSTDRPLINWLQANATQIEAGGYGYDT